MQKKKKHISSNKPPTALEGFLEINRIIPLNVPLPNAKELFLEYTFEIINKTEAANSVCPYHYDIPLIEKALEKTWETLKALSVINGFQNYLEFIEATSHGKTKNEFVEFFVYFTSACLAIREIAENVQGILQGQLKHGSRAIEELDEADPEYLSPVLFDLTTEVVLTKKKRIVLAGNHWTSAIDNIEAERLKICPICGYVFWAYRANQRWCLKKCSDVHFQKQRRSDPEIREKINTRRRKKGVKAKSLKPKLSKAEKAEMEKIEKFHQKNENRKEFLSKDFSKKD